MLYKIDQFNKEEKKMRKNRTYAHHEKDSIGYSKDFTPNESFEEQDLLCAYEHCIENQSLQDERDERSCPVFGHDCPGGELQVETCREVLEED
jgi:hypothetical protein